MLKASVRKDTSRDGSEHERPGGVLLGPAVEGFGDHRSHADPESAALPVVGILGPGLPLLAREAVGGRVMANGR